MHFKIGSIDDDVVFGNYAQSNRKLENIHFKLLGNGLIVIEKKTCELLLNGVCDW